MPHRCVRCLNVCYAYLCNELQFDSTNVFLKQWCRYLIYLGQYFRGVIYPISENMGGQLKNNLLSKVIVQQVVWWFCTQRAIWSNRLRMTPKHKVKSKTWAPPVVNIKNIIKILMRPRIVQGNSRNAYLFLIEIKDIL